MIKKIMEFGDAVRLSNSAYLLSTEKDTAQVRDELIASVLTTSDKLYIGELLPRAAWTGFSAGSGEAIRNIYSGSPINRVGEQPLKVTA
jgi:hypothetical protein